MKAKFTLIFVLCWIISPLGLAQSDEQDSVGYSLPSLDVLIDSAISNSALVQFYESEEEKTKIEHKLGKSSWTDGVMLGGESKYGSFGSNLELDNLSIGYGIGFTIRVPLSSITQQKKTNELNWQEVKSSQTQVQTAKDQIRNEVIKLYYEVQMKLDLIAVRTNALESSILHLQMAENEFKGGLITIAELARVNEVYTRQKALHAQGKAELTIAIKMLENLVGFTLEFR